MSAIATENKMDDEILTCARNEFISKKREKMFFNNKRVIISNYEILQISS